MGEGSGVLVMETLENAQKRGARIYAEVIGYSATCDAFHVTTPDGESKALTRCMNLALKQAAVPSKEVDYINAHGTGTAANDKTECSAVADVFGHHADKIMISSTKSMHGHIIGGTGAVELLACILALRDGIIAPTIGYEEQDPECALDIVPNEAREAKVELAISNAFAFGGLNAVII